MQVLYHAFSGRQWDVVLFCMREKLNKKGYFSPPCKQLAASHACTINGHLIGNNHFYLSKYKVGSCPWNRQLLVEPSGSIAWIPEDVDDHFLLEVVHKLKYQTAGAQLIFFKKKTNLLTTPEDLQYVDYRCIWCVNHLAPSCCLWTCIVP